MSSLLNNPNSNHPKGYKLRISKENALYNFEKLEVKHKPQNALKQLTCIHTQQQRLAYEYTLRASIDFKKQRDTTKNI